MANPPAFVPRNLMAVAGDFGEQDDVEFTLATTLDEALVLARVREQHELAYAVHRLLTKHGLSRADLADALGVKEDTLRAKLRGMRPAQEEDLILWSWITK